MKRPALGLALAALTSVASTAQSAPANCTPIVSVPLEITAPGVYCLTQNLVYTPASGSALLILSDDVTIDLSGFGVVGTAGPGTFASGAFAWSRRGLTIRNGSLGGFLYGVLLSDDETADWSRGGGHVLRDLTLRGNYFRGIRAEGRGVLVERCRITDTGGTTIFGAGNYAFGVESFGPGAQIVRNVIDRTTAGTGGEAVGISVSNSGHGTVVEGNVVSNEARSSQFGSFGVWIGGGSSVLLMDNRFTRLNFGAAYSWITTGLYRDNVSSDCLEVVRECDNTPACSGSIDNPAITDAGNNQ